VNLLSEYIVEFIQRFEKKKMRKKALALDGDNTVT